LKKALLLLLLIFGILLGLSASSPSPGGTLEPFPRGKPANPFLRIDVLYVPEGKVYGMDLEEYVKGVVASEMPASFHEEALRAQAILARTYAVTKMRIFGGTPRRPDADVSSDPKIDQAWNPQSVIKAKWGILGFWLNWSKIERAVEETRGLILTYQGLPCEVVYHSTCAGRTEAARDVWGKDVPYLQSVACPYCGHSPYAGKKTVTVSASEVAKALSSCLGQSIPAAKIAEKGAIVVSEVSPTGRVKELLVQGQRVRGLEFRAALGLNSTNFTWTSKGDSLLFQIQGYGHGAGLCQYGADGMAKQGKTFRDILSYYYPGTSVSYIFEE